LFRQSISKEQKGIERQRQRSVEQIGLTCSAKINFSRITDSNESKDSEGDH